MWLGNWGLLFVIVAALPLAARGANASGAVPLTGFRLAHHSVSWQ